MMDWSICFAAQDQSFVIFLTVSRQGGQRQKMPRLSIRCIRCAEGNIFLKVPELLELCVSMIPNGSKGEVMKKILSFVGGLAIAATAGSAHAATATANAGLTFTSGGTCTITGNVVNLGNFSATDTVAAYAQKFGSTTSQATPTANPVTLTTVNCTNTMAYNVSIKGNGTNNVAKVKRAGPVPVDVFDVVPQLTHINNTTVTKKYIHGDTTENTYFGTGTGAPQVFSGYWPVSNPSAGQLASLIEAGSYSADAVATVDF